MFKTATQLTIITFHEIENLIMIDPMIVYLTSAILKQMLNDKIKQNKPGHQQCW